MSQLKRKWAQHWESLCHRFSKKSSSIPLNATISSSSFSIQLINPHAIEVLNGLVNKNYNAYLVGGCIRDLLLNITPKDFDITTNAHPEAVRRIFKRSRMIGRRFRLVHVVFGREIIEVSTFRGPHHKNNNHSENDHGRILRDNVYGTMEEDALRRDFTINALYYDVHTQQVIDFFTGIQDIEAKRLKLLGDPETRYREDPVRMLRAARFAAKLDFDIDRETEAPIRTLAPLLQQIPGARLFDELIKLLLGGYGLKAWHQLKRLNLLPSLMQDTALLIHNNSQVEPLILLALQSTDTRIAQKKPVTPAFVLVALFWHAMIKQYEKFKKTDLLDDEAWSLAEMAVLDEQCQRFSIPKRFTSFIRDVWGLQSVLLDRSDKNVKQVTKHLRFRAAYDFLLLREESGESLKGAGEWWTQYQIKHPIPAPVRFKNKKQRFFKNKGRK